MLFTTDNSATTPCTFTPNATGPISPTGEWLETTPVVDCQREECRRTKRYGWRVAVRLVAYQCCGSHESACKLPHPVDVGVETGRAAQAWIRAALPLVLREHLTSADNYRDTARGDVRVVLVRFWFPAPRPSEIPPLEEVEAQVQGLETILRTWARWLYARDAERVHAGYVSAHAKGVVERLTADVYRAAKESCDYERRRAALRAELAAAERAEWAKKLALLRSNQTHPEIAAAAAQEVERILSNPQQHGPRLELEF